MKQLKQVEGNCLVHRRTGQKAQNTGCTGLGNPCSIPKPSEVFRGDNGTGNARNERDCERTASSFTSEETKPDVRNREIDRRKKVVDRREFRISSYQGDCGEDGGRR